MRKMFIKRGIVMRSRSALKTIIRNLKIDGTSSRSFLTGYIQNNSIGAEIGVWRGDFSELILSSGRVSKYYLIDPYEFMPQFPNRMYGGKVAGSQKDMDEIFESAKARVSKFQGEHIFIRKSSKDAASMVADASLDFLYIDGNHYYEGVREDLECYCKKLKNGGYLILDDWNWRDDEGAMSVRNATCDYLREHPNALQLAELRSGQAVFLVIDNYSSS